MSTKKEIKLGMTVKDKVTGFQGIAEHRATYLYGVDHICIQPPMKEDGTVPDSKIFDEPQIEIVNEERVIVADPPKTYKVKLGDKVEDKISKFQGIAIGRAFYLNGCVRVCIQPKNAVPLFGMKKNTEWFYEDQINILKTEPIKDVKEKPKHKKTGGPAMADSRR